MTARNPEFNHSPEGRPALAIIALMLLAALLRFYSLGEWSFWSDEISTLRDAEDLSNVSGYPVGYFLIGWTVRLLGTSEFTARLLPALFGILAVPVIYLMGRRLFTERAGVIAAAFLALAPFHLFFSQFARYYTLLMLLGMLGMWLAYEGIQKNRRGFVAASALLLALAGWTHWSAALLLPALAVYFIWTSRGLKRPVGLNALNLLILFGPFAIGGVVFAKSAVNLLVTWQGDSFSFREAGLTILKLADRMEPAAILLAVPAIWLLLPLHDRRIKWLLAWAIVPCALTVFFVGLAEGGTRFAIIALPAFMLLAGAGLDLLLKYCTGPRQRMAWAIAAVAVLSLGLKDALYFTAERGQRPRWKEAAAWVIHQPGAQIVYATTPSIFDYYAAHANSDLRGTPLADIAYAPPGAYIITEETANVAPNAAETALLDEKAEFRRGYPLRVHLLNYGVSVYQVTKPSDASRSSAEGQTSPPPPPSPPL